MREGRVSVYRAYRAAEIFRDREHNPLYAPSAPDVWGSVTLSRKKVNIQGEYAECSVGSKRLSTAHYESSGGMCVGGVRN